MMIIAICDAFTGDWERRERERERERGDGSSGAKNEIYDGFALGR
jgi:hypothetical protein